MAYVKTVWTNGSGEAINETNLNKIETGIFDNDAAIALKADSTQVLTDVPGGALFTDTVYDDSTTVKNASDGFAASASVNEIVSLSQAEYDGITTPDANTLYVVI